MLVIIVSVLSMVMKNVGLLVHFINIIVLFSKPDKRSRGKTYALVFYFSKVCRLVKLDKYRTQNRYKKKQAVQESAAISVGLSAKIIRCKRKRTNAKGYSQVTFTVLY